MTRAKIGVGHCLPLKGAQGVTGTRQRDAGGTEEAPSASQGLVGWPPHPVPRIGNERTTEASGVRAGLRAIEATLPRRKSVCRISKPICSLLYPSRKISRHFSGTSWLRFVAYSRTLGDGAFVLRAKKSPLQWIGHPERASDGLGAQGAPSVQADRPAQPHSYHRVARRGELGHVDCIGKVEAHAITRKYRALAPVLDKRLGMIGID